MIDDFLEKLRARYEAGDKAAILYCLNHCVVNHLPIPEWLATAFSGAYEKVRGYEVRSWDDVFGKPSKGKHLHTERRNMQIAERLFRMVQDRPEGVAIDDDLFEAVGRELGISKTVASGLYYEILDEMTSDD